MPEPGGAEPKGMPDAPLDVSRHAAQSAPAFAKPASHPWAGAPGCHLTVARMIRLAAAERSFILYAGACCLAARSLPRFGWADAVCESLRFIAKSRRPHFGNPMDVIPALFVLERTMMKTHARCGHRWVVGVLLPGRHGRRLVWNRRR